MAYSQAWTVVCLVLVCLTSWGSSVPLAAYQPTVVPGYPGAISGYPGAFYHPQLAGHQLSPYIYMPGPASKSVGTKRASGTPQQYSVVGNPEGFPNQGYFIAPYPVPGGVYPVPQYRSSSPVGTPVGQLPSGGQYLIYPAGTEPFRGDRQTTLWQNFQNFVQGLRPGNRPEKPERPDRPNPLNPFNWFGNRPSNPDSPPITQGEEEVAPAEEGDQASPAQPVVSNEVAEQESPAEPEEETTGGQDEEPQEKPQPEENSDPHVEVELVPAASVDVQGTEEAEEEAAVIASRILARSRYLPVVGIPRNVPRRRVGTVGGWAAEGGAAGAGGGAGAGGAGGGGAAPAGEEEVGEQDEEDEEEDSVVVGPGGTNPSVAQAKPAAIALAGVGGVAAAAPTATAVVGANGLAVAAPSATAIAGPSAGAPPPGLLPKFPSRRVPAQKVSPEEAQRNAAMIEAVRRQAQFLASGLGNLRSAGYPTLPQTAYNVWTGDSYGFN